MQVCVGHAKHHPATTQCLRRADNDFEQSAALWVAPGHVARHVGAEGHLEPCHDVDIDVLYPISVYADIGIMKRRYRRFDL